MPLDDLITAFDATLAEKLLADPDGTLDSYGLTAAQKTAILKDDLSGLSKADAVKIEKLREALTRGASTQKAMFPWPRP